MYIYFHKIVVTVVTTEASPDVIEKLIDKVGSDAGMRMDARTDPENRRLGPAVKIADPPLYPTTKDMGAENRWATEHDLWLDSWPSAEAFDGGYQMCSLLGG